MTQQSQIYISAPELLVPEDEPYRFDRLNREPSCDLLTRFVNRVEGPCTIAIDAAWGQGKTTFLRLWAANLKRDDFLILNVNAWETDYFNDPFLAIVGEMTKQLKASNRVDISEQGAFAKLRKCSTKIACIMPRVLASHVGITGEDIEEITGTLKTEARIRMEQYEKRMVSVEEFRSELESVAKEVREKTEKPLVVLVDELDRCRPTYAVEFLEVVKHLLVVNHVVYAFAMNRSELAHAVSGCYGPKFDGKGYLRRFFDVDFKLPLPSRQSFIGSLFKKQLAPIISDRYGREMSMRLLQAFFGVETISLRQVHQVSHRLRLVLLISQPDAAKIANHVVELCVALILRAYDPDILDKFLHSELSDRDVVESSLFSAVRNDANLFEERLLFETVVIRAAQEIAGKSPTTKKYEPTPFLQSYEELVGSTSTGLDAYSEKHFARDLVANVRRLSGTSHSFKFAVGQLEMLESMTNSSA